MQITNISQLLVVALMATVQAAPLVGLDSSLSARHHKGAGAAGGANRQAGAGGIASLFGGPKAANKNDKRDTVDTLMAEVEASLVERHHKGAATAGTKKTKAAKANNNKRHHKGAGAAAKKQGTKAAKNP